MNKKTLAALKESIKHWEEVASAESLEKVNLGPESCALCNVFNPEEGDLDSMCVGCPVNDRTGETLCDGTPYDRAYFAYKMWVRALVRETDIGSYARTNEARKEFQEAAREELAFLKSLLPEGETV